jgi:multidrug resistance efflux pump
MGCSEPEQAMANTAVIAVQAQNAQADGIHYSEKAGGSLIRVVQRVAIKIDIDTVPRDRPLVR